MPCCARWASTPALLDGTTYWIDPARAEQEGDLAHLYEPDCGMALVLDDGTRELQAMHAQASARRIVRATFDASGGMRRPVGYVIRTSMQGQAADYMRAQLTAKGTDAMQIDYLNFYARTYPGIKSAAPIAVSVGLLAATLLIAKSTHFVLVVPAALYLAHLAALRIARGAAASHWIYPLAHPDAVGAKPLLFRGLVRLFTVLPALLAVAGALLLAIDLLV